MDEISRKAARARGLKCYFTGVPCKHAHIAPRQVSNCSCLDCRRLHSAQFKQRQPDYFQKYRLLNLEALTSYERERYRKRKARTDA